VSNLSVNGARRLQGWLRECKELGWPDSAIPKLCDLWLEYHDDEGFFLRATPPAEVK
jgi:hypothetical protein